MAAVPITIVGIQTDEMGSRNVTITGMASLTGLGVGGGPVEPPSIWPSPGHPAHPIAPGGKPPSIWPSPGHPAHPIAPGGKPPTVWPGPGDPDYPIQVPPGIWPDPPEGIAPHPEHPIVIPPPAGSGAPPLEAKVVWTPQEGWQVVLVPTESAPPHPVPST